MAQRERVDVDVDVDVDVGGVQVGRHGEEVPGFILQDNHGGTRHYYASQCGTVGGSDRFGTDYSLHVRCIESRDGL